MKTPVLPGDGMGPAAYDAAPAARLLAQAWRSGRQLHEIPAEMRPGTIAEGYDLQDAFVAELGEATAGYKLGVGSPAGMRLTGLGRPVVGRVLASRRYDNGATVPLPHRHPATVEFEIAFVLGRDIAPAESLADPMAAVSEVRTTFELVISRFVKRRAVGWPSFAGDIGGFGALVVGDAFERSRMAAVAASVAITVDGKEVARALTGDEVTDPVSSFAHLVAHAKSRGIALRRGQIASLGAVGKPFDVTGNVEVVARYLDTELRFRTVAP